MSRAWLLIAAAALVAGCTGDGDVPPSGVGVVAYYALTWQIEGVDSCAPAEHLGLPETLLIDADEEGSDFVAFQYDCGPFAGGYSDAVLEGDNVLAPETNVLDCTRTRSGSTTPMRFVFAHGERSFTTHVTIERSVGVDSCRTSYLLTGARQ